MTLYSYTGSFGTLSNATNIQVVKDRVSEEELYDLVEDYAREKVTPEKFYYYRMTKGDNMDRFFDYGSWSEFLCATDEILNDRIDK